MSTPLSNRQVGTALVTGAAGFIGAALTNRLHDLGWTVTGIDDERTGDWRRVKAPVERIRQDLTSLTSAELLALAEGSAVVFHLAAEKYNSSRATPERILDVNVAATHRLFEAAALAGVGKLVFTSSLYAYGSVGPEPMTEEDLPRPTTLYGASKVAGEHMLRVLATDHGLRWTVGRLFFVYGPGQYAAGGYKSVIVANFERLRQRAAPVVHGDGTQRLDYVYLDDCVDALLAMAAPGNDSETFNIATGRGISVNELTRAMLRVAGGGPEPVHGPADWTAGTSRVGCPDAAAVRLGWSASTPLDKGLRRVWDSR